MRQAVMTEPGKIEFRDVPEPAPGPGEVLLRIKRIGVCGSDVHVNHGRHPFTSYPVVQGHEFSAVVEAVGAGDAFTAAMAMGLVHGTALDTIGQHANRLASYVCSQERAMPAIPDELY